MGGLERVASRVPRILGCTGKAERENLQQRIPDGLLHREHQDDSNYHYHHNEYNHNNKSREDSEEINWEFKQLPDWECLPTYESVPKHHQGKKRVVAAGKRFSRVCHSS